MRVQDIEIHAGDTDFEYEAVRRLEAKVEATTGFNPAPTIEEANMKLRELALKVGANAVVDVAYNSGISLTSWRSMTATGLAVRRLSDGMKCPECAETIKRAARKCRFCGAEVTPNVATARKASESAPEPFVVIDGLPRPTGPQRQTVDSQEPLKATNNTGIWYLMAGVAVVVLLPMLTMCSGS